MQIDNTPNGTIDGTSRNGEAVTAQESPLAAPGKTRHDILGWGADAALELRPGYPQEVRPPQPIGNPRPGIPTQQTVGTPSVPSSYRSTTAVYGTAIPVRGLSGVLRSYAYTIPDYKASRWALLLFADRVDVLEHNPTKLLIRIGVVAAAVYAVRSRRRRSLLRRLLG